MGRDDSDGDELWILASETDVSTENYDSFYISTIDQKGDQNGDSFHVTLIGIDYKGEMGIHSMGH